MLWYVIFRAILDAILEVIVVNGLYIFVDAFCITELTDCFPPKVISLKRQGENLGKEVVNEFRV